MRTITDTLKMMPLPRHSRDSVTGQGLITVVSVACPGLLVEMRGRCMEREAGRKLLHRPGPVRPLYTLR